MSNISILPEKLKSFDYYLKKLPLFLRQSDTFIEHFRIWFDLLNGSVDDSSGIVPTSDMLLYLLNIFDDDYINTINSMDNNDSGQVSDILDKLAEFFGVGRQFSIDYIDEQGQESTKDVNLNNNDLLILIKTQIIKNYCNGTCIQVEDFYKSVGLNVYVITTADSAVAHLHLANIPGSVSYSEDIQLLFASGLLQIESLGISYISTATELTGFLKWDSSIPTEQGWGIGVWAK